MDAPAAAVELIHAFSLVHDDLPSMDDDDLRRGKPTTHLAYDEATAILAGDALQPLAFRILSNDPELEIQAKAQLACIALLAEACGSLGMTGGQAMDLAAVGKPLDVDNLDGMHERKTGCLIRASVMMACCVSQNHSDTISEGLDRFARTIGLAFQIRDDILDVEGDTSVIGKPQGSDAASNKATYPALMGLQEAKERADNLYDTAMTALQGLDVNTAPLELLAAYVVSRDS